VSVSVEHDDLLAAAARTLPGGVLGSFALPPEIAFVPAGASGSHLRTTDGRDFIDYVIGGGPMLVGHGHPEVLDATRRQLERGVQFYSYLNEPAIQLAEVLADAIPCAEHIRFCTSGSEATMYALRYARAHTGRDRVVKMEGAYHGNHDATMLATWPKQAGRVDFDSAGVLPAWRDHVAVARFNDLESVAAVFDRHAGEVAAVLVEPYQRFLPPAPGFLEGLRRLCDLHGGLLVFDEVVTGFRMGYTSAQGRYGVTPDLATFGKIIGGGFPLAAVAGPAAVLDRSDPAGKGTPEFVYQSGTLNGHPVACAAGLATLAVLARPGTYEALEQHGARLRDGLRELLAARGEPAVVMGEDAGVWHVCFGLDSAPVTGADASRADAARLKRFHLALIAEGAFVLPGLRSYLSTAHDDADIDHTLEMAAAALTASAEGGS
jgi:glutamate-1-semialdehyde 2,1-aminomutase